MCSREPIDLYPNIQVQLKSLKYDLTFRIWEYKGTSQLKAIQYQSINQGFRMVGASTPSTVQMLLHQAVYRLPLRLMTTEADGS